jgi:ribosomal protein S18 acetylase RimI-like enzyme
VPATTGGRPSSGTTRQAPGGRVSRPRRTPPRTYAPTPVVHITDTRRTKARRYQAHRAVGRQPTPVVRITDRQRAKTRRYYRRVNRLARELLRQRKAEERRTGGFARAVPLSPRVQESSIFGIGEADIGRFLKSNVTGRQTPLGGFARGIGELAKPGARDLVSLPQNVVVGGYYTGRAAYKAARGDSREGRELWRQFKEMDPVALAVQGRFGESKRQAEQHPLLTLLEVAGPVKGGSRLAGRAVKPRRVDRSVEGTRIREVRREPQGVLGRGVGRGVQRARVERSRRYARRAEEAMRRGELDKADDLQRRSLRADPSRVPDRAIEHQVDVLAEGLSQSIRRPHRAQEAKRVRQALGFKRGRAPEGGEAIGLLARNIAKADPADLRAYLRTLDEQYPKLGPAKARANRRMAGQIRKVLAGKGDLAQLERAARSYAGVANTVERELIAARMLDPEEATRAKLKDYAVRYMGAKWDAQKNALMREVESVIEERVPRTSASRGEFVAGRAKADPRDVPTVASLVTGLTNRRGKPGITRETEHGQKGSVLYEMDRGREAAGQKPLSVSYVYRSENGEPAGVLTILLDPDGKPSLMSIAVDPALRGRGIGKSLVAKAAEEFDPASLRAALDEGGLSEAGAGLVHSVLDANPETRTTKRVTQRPVSTGAIKQHMRSRGIDPESTAFVSERPGGGDSAFNVSSRKAQGVNRRRKTGKGVAQGLIDLAPKRLVEQVVRSRGLVDADRSWKRFISHFGHRNAKGNLNVRKNKPQAEALAANLEATTGREWAVVRVIPWQGRREQLQAVVSDADAEGYVKGGGHPVSEAIEAAAKGDGIQGPWAVVPRAAAQRMVEHAQVYRASGPVARAVTQSFRRTVLPLSTSWLTGNVIEGAVRTAVAGAGPRSWLTYRRVYNQLAVGDPSIRRALRRLPEPQQGSIAEQLLHMTPGGHFGGSLDTMIRVSARQLEGKPLEPLAKAMHRLYEKPGPGTMAKGYRAYSDWVFQTMNSGVEAQFTRAMAGKYIRKELMTRESRYNNQRAIEQGAQGIRNTPEQVGMADYVRRAYGQYDSMPPWARKWVLTYTPFGAWTFNAVKFLYSVLPRDHPMLTAVLAANHQLTEDWRKSHGLDQWAKDAVPPFLQGSIPLPGGKKLRVARYTPFGVMADPLSTVASNVLPQFSGPLMAFRGLDWKGDPLKGGDGKPVTDPYQLAAIGAREFAFASVPGIGLAVRALQKGPRQTFDPFRPIAPKRESSEKNPVDEALDDALEGGGGKSIDDAIDDALKGIRFEAGGTEGARQRAADEAQARFEREQARARHLRFGNTGRNYVPQSQYPTSPRRRVRA